jgi:hypothetical protein
MTTHFEMFKQFIAHIETCAMVRDFGDDIVTQQVVIVFGKDD